MESPLSKGSVKHFGKIGPKWSMPAEFYGRSIDKRQQPAEGGGGGSAFDGDWPLKLVAVDTENVKVLSGTVSGISPTDVNTSIDVSGTDGTWYFYMHVTISGTTASAPEVLSDTTGGMDSSDDTATDSYRPIGEVDVASSVITAVRPSMAWSQNVSICTADTPPYYWTTGS